MKQGRRQTQREGAHADGLLLRSSIEITIMRSTKYRYVVNSLDR